MKRIKGVKRAKHNLAVKAVRDYYGSYDPSSPKIVEFLVGKKVSLNELEKSDAWKIQQNMGDEIYMSNLTGTTS